MNNTEKKRMKEKQTVGLMICLYCRKKHGCKAKLCPDCQKLYNYSIMRSDNCPFTETKTFCSNCKVHCYNTQMRNKIREVMRFSGPRMILYHPITAIQHVITNKQEKTRMEKNK